MVSLIDLIFILLLFFLTTSIMIRYTKGESKLFIPTPKNEPGDAQILIQIIDEEQFLWIDYTAIDTLNKYGYLLADPNDSKIQIDLLSSKMTINSEMLNQRLEKLLQSSSRLRKREYFVLIRCPNHLPYYYATNIIEYLIDNPYFEYGCVSGTIEDIRYCKNLVIEGNILQIDL